MRDDLLCLCAILLVMLVNVIILSVVWQVFLNLPNEITGNRELFFSSFQDERIEKDTERCKYSADSGFVCPLMQDSIVPYQRAPPPVQMRCAEELVAEWGSAFSPPLTTMEEMQQLIRDRWVATDVLYVAYDISPFPSFVGCVAVDRDRFYPFVSHLYVTPARRREGHGRRLLAFAETYIGTLGFSEARLWCKPSLVGYYRSLGWQVEREGGGGGGGSVVMVKTLNA